MSYLTQIHEQTPTRIWVNNPTRADSESAIALGAVGVTTNPAFCSKLLQTEPEHLGGIIDAVLAETTDLDEAAERVYHRASQALMQQWLPIYERSGGERGFVTIQEDPRHEEDTAHILEASLRAAELGPNYMAKVPVTAPGLEVIRELVAHDIAICATEVFSIAQYEAAVEAYEEASKRSGKTPPIYITHITGITDEYFRGVVKAEKIDLPEELLAKAGTVVGRREYALWAEARRRGHRLIGGGARGPEHFTNFVGLDMDITMNWSMIAELDASGRGVDDAGFDEPTADEVSLLAEKLPGFARAIAADGLAVDEFADFGPVMLFRTQFLNGYVRLLDTVADARSRVLVHA